MLAVSSAARKPFHWIVVSKEGPFPCLGAPVNASYSAEVNAKKREKLHLVPIVHPVYGFERIQPTNGQRQCFTARRRELSSTRLLII